MMRASAQEQKTIRASAQEQKHLMMPQPRARSACPATLAAARSSSASHRSIPKEGDQGRAESQQKQRHDLASAEGQTEDLASLEPQTEGLTEGQTEELASPEPQT